jgi:signal transduction histidine kinase
MCPKGPALHLWDDSLEDDALGVACGYAVVGMPGDDGPILTRPLSRTQLFVLDGLVAVAYAAVLSGMLLAQPASSVPLRAREMVVLAMSLPLVVRRAWPVPVFTVVFTASVVSLLLGIVHDGFVGAGYALYVVALMRDRPRSEPTLLIAVLGGVGVVSLVVGGSAAPLGPDLGSVVVGVVVLAGSWTVGRAVRERRRFAQQAADRLVERVVEEERLRIARDLHDIVAHGLSLIVVKAGTANHVSSVRPEEARDALQVIETTGRAALVEMRRMLEVLRDPAVEVAELGPAPTLEQLPALAERVSLAGVPVELDMCGTAGLPDGVALSVYRIVQEALTNVVKHAAPARCRVTIEAVDGEASVEIVDDGLRAGMPGEMRDGIPGQGLLGMRERVRILGGELTAGPRPQGGFRVFARIPYAVGSSTPAGET